MDFKKETDINISKVANDLIRKDTLSGNIKCPYCGSKLRYTIFSTYFCPKCLRDIK